MERTTAIPEDYHLHTTFSMDSQTTMPDLCERAIALGIPEICVTDHLDLIRTDGGAGYFKPEPYFAEIERCKAKYADRLRLKGGVEMGETHRFADQLQKIRDGYPIDFIIGSLHWVGDEFVLSHRYFEGKTAEQAYGTYFDEMLRMVKSGGFDVVGHLDVPKRYGFDVYGPFDPFQFKEGIRAILRACIESGIGIEINHGSLRRAVAEPSPAIDVLTWYRELGGEILTIGSDGHRLNAVGDRLDQAVEQARAAGFTHLTTFERRQPSFVPLPT